MASQPPSSEVASTSSTYKPRYIDIGINLADPIFRGMHNGKQRHPDDLEAVVSRAKEVGCTKLLVTGSDFASNRDALKLAEQFREYNYTSSIFSSEYHGPSRRSSDAGTEAAAGHSTPCDPDPSAPLPDSHLPDPTKSASIIVRLTDAIKSAQSSSPGRLAAFGEFGLDYDRLHYCSKNVQLHSFAAQLEVAASLEPQLPLFLHSRAAHDDFVRLLKDAFGPRLEGLRTGGVVHSFTGSAEEARELMDLGLYIGINGCSFKTAENCAVVKEVALDRIMLETDGPWCEVRPSHEGYKYLIEKKDSSQTEGQQQGQQKKKNQKKEPDVPERFKVVKKEKWVEGAMIKGRNEPCSIERVAKIVAAIKGVTVEDVCEAAWRNTIKVFGLGEQVA
ncbi:TatD DNase family protein [Geosmithia morbida]|uniref:TatD DNase family protein n=1 Tax=Geosmithia morbida TaxID=1094350 RepID=A0A9P4Z1S2_9HYPO|nr:TatD DNase family protein [Geosmithia morbida]KAF4125831.1 TatD DNase family protein [Geosmithia morbida]